MPFRPFIRRKAGGAKPEIKDVLRTSCGYIEVIWMNRAAALRAYAQVSLTGRNAREIEAEALAKANRLLRDGQQALPDYPRYADALRFNQSLWDLIQCDLISPDNALPPELRNNLLQLSLFVDRQTLAALGNPNGDLLHSLIELNQQLLEGLRETPPA